LIRLSGLGEQGDGGQEEEMTAGTPQVCIRIRCEAGTHKEMKTILFAEIRAEAVVQRFSGQQTRFFPQCGLDPEGGKLDLLCLSEPPDW
jgi:hypothetical protein